MAQIAYRTLDCGWTLQKAKDEIDQMTGWKSSALGTGEEFMDRFYLERVEGRSTSSDSVSRESSSLIR